MATKTNNFQYQKLINVQSRGVLSAVTEPCQRIFLISEEIFRSHTTNRNIRKIDVDLIKSEALQNMEVASIFDTIIEDVITKSEIGRDIWQCLRQNDRALLEN